jgi:hypothetical protein
MKQTLLDTFCPDYFDYEFYKNWCEDNDCTPADRNSQAFYDWYQSEREFDIESFFANLSYSKLNLPCVVTGSVGRWDGRFEIKLHQFESVEEAIRKCWSGCDDVKVTKRASVLDVEAYHHDGCNYFEIRVLSDLGYDRYGRNGKVNMNDRKNFLTLPKYLW